MNKIKQKNKIVSFPNNLTNGEKVVEAIIFAKTKGDVLSEESIEKESQAKALNDYVKHLIDIKKNASDRGYTARYLSWKVIKQYVLMVLR